MNFVQITPGAGGMYCGNCFRDNALVAELRRQGHQTLMIPLYLPMTLEEADQSTGTPIFFNGINVYLEQKWPWFRRAPQWVHQLTAAPALLKLVAGSAAKTRAEDVGDTMISMLRGENGHQARELDELIAWLKTQPKPDAICLSNALLIGMARKLRQELQAPVISLLQGEDSYLDSLLPAHREAAWELMIQRAADVSLFLTPSQYFATIMARRLKLPDQKIRILANGINLEGFMPAQRILSDQPTLGFFARMCKDKGLDLLVGIYIELRRRNSIPGLRLKIGGGCGPADEAFINEQKNRLQKAGVLADVEWHPNLDRAAKLAFLQSLTLFCVPAMYGEAFGLYVIEAMAAGIPLVQPRVAAFPEIIEPAGAGLLAEPNVGSMADAMEQLLRNPSRLKELGANGQKAAAEKYSMPQMARNLQTIVTGLGQS